MQRHASLPQKFFLVTVFWDFVTNLLYTSLYSTDYFQNLQGVLMIPAQKTREMMGLQKRNSLHLRTSGRLMGWCYLRHRFWSWAQDHTQERFWNSQKLGIRAGRVPSSCSIWIMLHSTHQCLPRGLSHIIIGLHSAQQPQQHLAIGGAGKSFFPGLLKIFA